jgi:hypothetical protein
MELTKYDLERIARGRYFKLHIHKQLWIMVLSLIWALCWTIPSRDATLSGNYIFMIIGMIPLLVEVVILYYLIIKESKYVAAFMAENNNLIGKEL